MEFTILQSVYKNDNADYLNSCFLSISKSTVKPKEIILVKDGEISESIEYVITKWISLLPLNVVGYEINKGLAYALQYGLQYVKTDLVARMDSDDIVYPDRFEKQLAFFEKNDDLVLLSGYIDEFNNDESIIVSTRKVPLEHEEIKHYLKKRNAFNHMSVMFKKEAILQSGGYQIVPFFEDYDLWIRVVQNGYKVANIPEKLIKARIGNDMIGRRHGISYAKHEINFLKRQLKSSFINKNEYYKLVILRVPVRLLPKWGLKIIYRILRGKK